MLKEAKLLYKDGDYDIVKFGDYVVCAVTNNHIMLDNLSYWSVKRQEAYIDCAASLSRELELSTLI